MFERKRKPRSAAVSTLLVVAMLIAMIPFNLAYAAPGLIEEETQEGLNGEVIRNLIITGTETADRWYIKTIQMGEHMYSDRDYLITTLPGVLSFNEWIQTPNDAKNELTAGNIQATFMVAEDAWVYVGYDTALLTWDQPGLVPWLAPELEWIDLGNIAIGSDGGALKLYKKEFKAGETVTLGGFAVFPNGSLGNGSMYTAAVIPSRKAQLDPSTPPPPTPVPTVTPYPMYGPAFSPDLTLTIKGVEVSDGAILSKDVPAGGTTETAPPHPMVSYNAIVDAFGLNGNKIEIEVGSTTAMVNGETVNLFIAPRKNGDDDYWVPYDFISDALGLKAVFNFAKGTLSIDEGAAYKRMKVEVIRSSLNNQAKELFLNDNDFDQSKSWDPTGAGTTFFEYDLGAVYTIGAVGIAWQTSSQYWVFQVDVSTDGVNWTTVYNGISTFNTPDLQIYGIDEVDARYVRQVGWGRVQGNASSNIVEYAVYGVDGPKWEPIELATPRTVPGVFYVSPTASGYGDGSIDRPWDLRTALSGQVTIPSDKLYLRGGTYYLPKLVGPAGDLYSYLKGTPENPILVKEYPGEHAIVDLASTTKPNMFYIRGEYTHYYGIEVVETNAERYTIYAGSWTMALGSLSVGGDVNENPDTFGIKLINMILHDCGSGVGAWTGARDIEVHGCTIYNNGWEAGDRGHGHGVYTQNYEGTKSFHDNIIFNQYGMGIQAYTEGSYIRGFDIQRNIVFNSGTLSFSNGAEPNIIVAGGDNPKENINIVGNHFYTSLNRNTNVHLGYPKNVNEFTNVDVTLKDNYITGGRIGALVNTWVTAIVTGNRIGNSTTLTHLGVYPESDLSTYTWDRNNYFGASNRFDLGVGDGTSSFAFDSWKDSSAFDGNSMYVEDSPTGVETFVYPNAYEEGRANIVVYNWDMLDIVNLDVSFVPGLQIGDKYKIVSAKDFFGEPVATGVYDGSKITVTTVGLTAPKPLGWESVPYPQDWTFEETGKEFNVYVLLKDEASEPAIIKAEASAVVTKDPDNTNTLTITVTETLSNGKVNIITKKFTIKNNASGTYSVCQYRVYVATSGNTKVTKCYIVE